MPPVSQYLPVATGAGANVDTQANFAGSGYQTEGFGSGLAESKQFNKVWRQASMVAAAITQFIANQLAVDINDDGNLTNLIAQFTAAVANAGEGIEALGGGPTLSFNCANFVKFDVSLTQNITASSITGQEAGDVLFFIFHQDATGGRTFAWPSQIPGGTIDLAPNATSVQAFIVDAAVNIQPFTTVIG